MTAVLRNKVQKQLNISANTKSFSPMFNFGSSVHASVALEHFILGFVEVRRFQMHNRGSGSFRNLDCRSYGDFASSTIGVSGQHLTLRVLARVGISWRQLKSDQFADLRSNPFQDGI